jgi:hypothetical protein
MEADELDVWSSQHAKWRQTNWVSKVDVTYFLNKVKKGDWFLVSLLRSSDIDLEYGTAPGQGLYILAD